MTSNHFSIKKSLIAGTTVCLEGREHHHLSRVVRFKPHEQVWLFDEEGTKYRAEVEQVGREQTRLRLLEKRTPVRSRSGIKLAQALLKAKPMEWIIQKGTELGMDAFIPIIAARCVVKLDEGAPKKVRRWAQIARESSKQCRSGRSPEILPPRSLDDFLAKMEAGQRIFLSENSGRPLKDVIGLSRDTGARTKEVVILVGPEGGWTAQERERILCAGFEAACLGPNIYRAETASLAAMAIISHLRNREYVSSGTEGR